MRRVEAKYPKALASLDRIRQQGELATQSHKEDD